MLVSSTHSPHTHPRGSKEEGREWEESLIEGVRAIDLIYSPGGAVKFNSEFKEFRQILNRKIKFEENLNLNLCILQNIWAGEGGVLEGGGGMWRREWWGGGRRDIHTNNSWGHVTVKSHKIQITIFHIWFLLTINSIRFFGQTYMYLNTVYSGPKRISWSDLYTMFVRWLA